MDGPHGIHVNAVAPGGGATGILLPAPVPAAGAARLRSFHTLIPSMATAEQLAASSTLARSDDAPNSTGALLLEVTNSWCLSHQLTGQFLM
jgi:NAD(P)-dependent dehydrogenase (short-subunit alcohol dehydrogenase family)